MKFDPFNPFGAYRTAMDEAIDAMRPARLIEEQTRKFANLNSFSGDVDFSGMRALAREGEQWRKMTAMDSLLDERQRFLDQIVKIQNPFPPSDYEKLVKAAGFSHKAVDEIANYQSLMKSAMDSTTDAVSIISQWDHMAARLAGSLQSYAPNSYTDDYIELVRGIDFNPIEAIVRGFDARRLNDGDAKVESSPRADDQNTLATFDLIQSVATATATKIFQEADRRGLLPNKHAARVKFWLYLLFNVVTLVIAVASLQLQITQAPVAAVEVSASQRTQEPAWSEEGVMISTTTVNLRLGPSTRQRVLATISSGTLLRKRKAKADWILVEYVDPNGEGSTIRGWIRSKYLRAVEADAWIALWCAIGEPTPASNHCAPKPYTER